jgi:hypothetical protein
MKLLLAIASLGGLLIRFLPGGMIARLALGLVNNWRAVAIVALGLVIFGCGLRSGYLGGYTRGENAGFAKGVEHHARVIAEDNAKRAAVAVKTEREVVAQTNSVRKSSDSLRDAKQRLCKLDPNCVRGVRKPRPARKVAAHRQLADDKGDPGGERPAGGLLR